MKNYPMTMIIPTNNRPQEIVDLVNYLLDHFDLTVFKILILDGSDSRMSDGILNSWQRANIIYKYYGPGLSLVERWFDGLKSVDTELVGFVADDDIPHPDGYNKCIEFLQTHQEYCTAHGSYTGFKLVNNRFEFYYSYRPYSIEEDDPALRLHSFLKGYQPIAYAVYRTEALKTAFLEVERNVDTDDFQWFELLLGCIPIVLGKLKYIKEPFYARNHGDSVPRPKVVYYRLFYEEDFSHKYSRVKRALINYFPEEYPKQALNDIIDTSFAAYHSKMFNISEIENDMNILMNCWTYGSLINRKLKSGYYILIYIKNMLIGRLRNQSFNRFIKRTYISQSQENRV